VLERLDPARRNALIQFLGEANLVQSVEGRAPIITLSSASLNLNHFVLEGSYTLNGANLSGANLDEADLSFADLSNAALRDADLRDVDLWDANLSNARGITKEQLEKQTENLKGAIMPDGSEHP
jgi:uncharacterized protein YjbI with pentapeptide repeats